MNASKKPSSAAEKARPAAVAKRPRGRQRTLPDGVLEDSSDDRRKTRERILDVAEELFSRNGYFGASVRDITSAVGVDVCLISYHFGSKEELFHEVLLRRADALAGGLRLSLQNAVDAAAPRPPSVEALVEAFIRPKLQRLASKDPGWSHYLKLITLLANLEHQHYLVAPSYERYGPIYKSYIEAFEQALPACNSENIRWSFHLLQLAIGAFHRNIRDEQAAPSWRLAMTDIESTLARMVPYFASGFYRLAGL